jgi:hypothetical protein
MKTLQATGVSAIRRAGKRELQDEYASLSGLTWELELGADDVVMLMWLKNDARCMSLVIRTARWTSHDLYIVILINIDKPTGQDTTATSRRHVGRTIRCDHRSGLSPANDINCISPRQKACRVRYKPSSDRMVWVCM